MLGDLKKGWEASQLTDGQILCALLWVKCLLATYLLSVQQLASSKLSFFFQELMKASLGLENVYHKSHCK